MFVCLPLFIWRGGGWPFWCWIHGRITIQVGFTDDDDENNNVDNDKDEHKDRKATSKKITKTIFFWIVGVSVRLSAHLMWFFGLLYAGVVLVFLLLQVAVQ